MTKQTTKPSKIISLDLIDELGLITEQAKGVLQLISVNLNADNQANDEIVGASIRSAIADIEKIDEIIGGAERIVGEDAPASVAPANKPTQSKPSLDSIFESAQRAHAVILLLIDACSDPAYGDAITYSLWAVERELKEIKEGLDAELFDGSAEVQGGAA
ncbi:hypothetical protein [Methylomonas methanica]|uniref:Uncharacterized protein n=1 Tax=Methylomonas methanica (strain DSM 25384 / MC09) TaxID=857087 RepID=G0A3S9_METMM|nr:hypothetical protein [Methylomonas methanica]AEG02701.1 hypothetical protein Metme_4353 [Methylomonas methanica MC09]